MFWPWRLTRAKSRCVWPRHNPSDSASLGVGTSLRPHPSPRRKKTRTWRLHSPIFLGSWPVKRTKQFYKHERKSTKNNEDYHKCVRLWKWIQIIKKILNADTFNQISQNVVIKKSLLWFDFRSTVRKRKTCVYLLAKAETEKKICYFVAVGFFMNFNLAYFSWDVRKWQTTSKKEKDFTCRD